MEQIWPPYFPECTLLTSCPWADDFEHGASKQILLFCLAFRGQNSPENEREPKKPNTETNAAKFRNQRKII